MGRFGISRTGLLGLFASGTSSTSRAACERSFRLGALPQSIGCRCRYSLLAVRRLLTDTRPAASGTRSAVAAAWRRQR